MIHRRFTDPMPGQAAIEALKELRPSRRRRLLKSVASTTKRVFRRLMPKGVVMAMLADRATRRQRMQEFAASTLKHLCCLLMPDDAAIAARASRWLGWY